MVGALVLAATGGGVVGVSGPASATASFPLPSTCVIHTFTNNYVTAVGGGGRTTDVIHTNATEPRTEETFRVVDAGGGYVGIQTFTGNYVTAVGGGGQVRGADAIHTNATVLQGWEKFKLVPVDGQPAGVFGIQTINGQYLTAVGGGGQTTDVIYTSETHLQGWEWFRFVCDGGANDGSVTLQPLSGVAGLPTIRCSIMATKPAVQTIGGQIRIGSTGSTICAMIVDQIEMTHTLLLSNSPVAVDRKRTLPSTNHADTQPNYKCAGGVYSTTALAIVSKAGYETGATYTPTDQRTTIKADACLPNVLRLADGDARAYIAALGLVVGTVTHQSSDQPIDTVISQSLEADGRSVDLVESSGNVTVPNVLGWEEADAINAIEGRGLVADVRHQEDCISTGDVETQHPIGGARALLGDPVTITVSTCNTGGGTGGTSGGSGGSIGGGGSTSGSIGGPTIQPRTPVPTP